MSTVRNLPMRDRAAESERRVLAAAEGLAASFGYADLAGAASVSIPTARRAVERLKKRGGWPHSSPAQRSTADAVDDLAAVRAVLDAVKDLPRRQAKWVVASCLSLLETGGQS